MSLSRCPVDIVLARPVYRKVSPIKEKPVPSAM